VTSSKPTPLPVPTWVWTDDPADPCTYCAQWFTPEEFAGTIDRTAEISDEDFDDEGYVWWENPKRMAPYMPDGPAPRLYGRTHAECRRAVSDHVNQHQDDVV
jgi:hypothetical protein